MDQQPNRQPRKREYPPLYERAVPIVLAVIGVGILVLLAVILAVALGVLRGA